MAKLQDITKEEQANILAQYLPANQCYASAFIDGSVLRKILIGLGSTWLGFRDFLNKYYDNYDPQNTTELISEWETDLGIPSSCVPIADNLEDRRKFILFKLAGFNASTEQQILNIASILNLNTTITKGVNANTISPALTIPFVLVGDKEAPYTIIINIAGYTADNLINDDLTIPFIITNESIEVFSCLINKLIPSNVFAIINYT